MKYLSNRKKGKNTRKIHRQNVAKYNRRYYIRLDKFMALYGVFTFDLSEGWSVRLRDRKAKNPNTPYYEEYEKGKYALKKNFPNRFLELMDVKRGICRVNKIVLRQSMDSKRKN